jgi:hypothetical protein
MLGVSDASGMFDITGTMLMVYWLFVYGLKSIWLPFLWPVFNQIFLTRTRDEWLEILRQKDTCVAPVYSPGEVISDPHLIARGMFVKVLIPPWARPGKSAP